MLNTDFAPWPSFTEEEAEAVSRVLLSNRVNSWTGEETHEFEKEFAAWTGANYAIALSNGTVGLDLALRAIGCGPGDEVIVTCRTFIASVSCIINLGATPVFADVNPESQNITTETIQSVLSSKTKAIICVHLAGWPCEMDPIMELATIHNLTIIEDCAQAHGARYKGRSVGSLGHIAAWSFCQDKIMTTGGEGGMVTTSDPNLWKWMWSYKDHGKCLRAAYEVRNTPEFHWVHHGFGTNGRMTEMQAAIGRIQLRRMPQWHAQRLKNANQIWEAATQLPALRVPKIPLHIEHAAYKCYIFINPDYLEQERNRHQILSDINHLKVPCFSGSCPEVYMEKAFDETQWRPIHRLPVAQELGETSLMFLVHPTVTNKEMERTCNALRIVFNELTNIKPSFRALFPTPTT